MSTDVFFLQRENVYALPITHYTMEMAAEVNKAFHALKPDCIAVELDETMQLQLLHAAARLPDLTVVIAETPDQKPLYYLAEPCDASFEALRLALEHKCAAYCIDLNLEEYPQISEPLPDAYSIQRIGLKAYYELYMKVRKGTFPEDEIRELHMARRLKELSLRYEKVLFVGGMAHVENIMLALSKNAFPHSPPSNQPMVRIATLTEDSAREVMAECGYFSKEWEDLRGYESPDRQKIILKLSKEAASLYQENTGNLFPGYNLRNTMKFSRNWALLTGRLLPDLFQILNAAKGCVDSNYAYEMWKLATDYPHLKNIDGLEELALTSEELWGQSKKIRFHLKETRTKGTIFHRRKKDRSKIKFEPPGPFSICSYPPEDVSIENFGEFLKKKGTQLLSEEGARTLPFTTSLEDGIDTRETIRHFSEKKLYIKSKGKPPGGVGSVVIVFDEDYNEEDPLQEKFPWKMTWIGEHNQESDMAFYATHMNDNVVGPGISRCEYGGFMMSYPPRRVMDVWHDPDYHDLKTKAEVLLAAAIDYSVKPVIVYVASKPPRSQLKSWAKRYGKKVVYIPIGQLSPVTLNKLRAFHVLGGHDKRSIAGEYIF